MNNLGGGEVKAAVADSEQPRGGRDQETEEAEAEPERPRIPGGRRLSLVRGQRIDFTDETDCSSAAGGGDTQKDSRNGLVQEPQQQPPAGSCGSPRTGYEGRSVMAVPARTDRRPSMVRLQEAEPGQTDKSSGSAAAGQLQQRAVQGPPHLRGIPRLSEGGGLRNAADVGGGGRPRAPGPPSETWGGGLAAAGPPSGSGQSDPRGYSEKQLGEPPRPSAQRRKSSFVVAYPLAADTVSHQSADGSSYGGGNSTGPPSRRNSGEGRAGGGGATDNYATSAISDHMAGRNGTSVRGGDYHRYSAGGHAEPEYQQPAAAVAFRRISDQVGGSERPAGGQQAASSRPGLHVINYSSSRRNSNVSIA